MLIKCFRHFQNYNVEKEIEHADDTNADYIMAEDTKTIELAEDGTPVEIQKTGIVCPNCYKLTDFVIWGVHK